MPAIHERQQEAARKAPVEWHRLKVGDTVRVIAPKPTWHYHGAYGVIAHIGSFPKLHTKRYALWSLWRPTLEKAQEAYLVMDEDKIGPLGLGGVLEGLAGRDYRFEIISHRPPTPTTSYAAAVHSATPVAGTAAAFAAAVHERQRKATDPHVTMKELQVGDLITDDDDIHGQYKYAVVAENFGDHIRGFWTATIKEAIEVYQSGYRSSVVWHDDEIVHIRIIKRGIPGPKTNNYSAAIHDRQKKAVTPLLDTRLVEVWDNGGMTGDRYTVIIDEDVYDMSENALMPNGINMWHGKLEDLPGARSGTKVEKFDLLPVSVRIAISRRLETYMMDDNESFSAVHRKQLDAVRPPEKIPSEWTQTAETVWERTDDRGTISLLRTGKAGGVYDYQGQFTRGEWVAEVYGETANDYQRIVYKTKEDALIDIEKYMNSFRDNKYSDAVHIKQREAAGPVLCEDCRSEGRAEPNEAEYGCVICGLRFCDGHISVCNFCDNHYCRSCADGGGLVTCYICGLASCYEHLTYCKSCRHFMCNFCMPHHIHNSYSAVHKAQRAAVLGVTDWRRVRPGDLVRLAEAPFFGDAEYTVVTGIGAEGREGGVPSAVWGIWENTEQAALDMFHSKRGHEEYYAGSMHGFVILSRNHKRDNIGFGAAVHIKQRDALVEIKRDEPLGICAICASYRNYSTPATTRCADCGYSHCNEHSRTCEHCDTSYCLDCLRDANMVQCKTCAKYLCDNCRRSWADDADKGIYYCPACFPTASISYSAVHTKQRDAVTPLVKFPEFCFYCHGEGRWTKLTPHKDYQCTVCGRGLCAHCFMAGRAEHCYNCGEVVCDDCLRNCAFCLSSFCQECWDGHDIVACQEKEAKYSAAVHSAQRDAVRVDHLITDFCVTCYDELTGTDEKKKRRKGEYWCADCGYGFCKEHIYYCVHCEKNYCSTCSLGGLTTCDGCGSSVCDSCLTQCTQCSKVYCLSCIGPHTQKWHPPTAYSAAVHDRQREATEPPLVDYTKLRVGDLVENTQFNEFGVVLHIGKWKGEWGEWGLEFSVWAIWTDSVKEALNAYRQEDQRRPPTGARSKGWATYTENTKYKILKRGKVHTYSAAIHERQREAVESIPVCNICGNDLKTEDTHLCSACEEHYCENCWSSCTLPGCETEYCQNCFWDGRGTTCDRCGDLYCTEHYSNCPNCDGSFCAVCYAVHTIRCFESYAAAVHSATPVAGTAATFAAAVHERQREAVLPVYDDGGKWKELKRRAISNYNACRCSWCGGEIIVSNFLPPQPREYTRPDAYIRDWSFSNNAYRGGVVFEGHLYTECRACRLKFRETWTGFGEWEFINGKRVPKVYENFHRHRVEYAEHRIRYNAAVHSAQREAAMPKSGDNGNWELLNHPKLNTYNGNVCTSCNGEIIISHSRPPLSRVMKHPEEYIHDWAFSNNAYRGGVVFEGHLYTECQSCHLKFRETWTGFGEWNSYSGKRVANVYDSFHLHRVERAVQYGKYSAAIHSAQRLAVSPGIVDWRGLRVGDLVETIGFAKQNPGWAEWYGVVAHIGPKKKDDYYPPGVVFALWHRTPVGDNPNTMAGTPEDAKRAYLFWMKDNNVDHLSAVGQWEKDAEEMRYRIIERGVGVSHRYATEPDIYRRALYIMGTGTMMMIVGGIMINIKTTSP